MKLVNIYTNKNVTKNVQWVLFYLICISIINNVLNVMLPSVRKQLPNVFITGDDAANRAPLEAGFTEQTRTELWDTFKSLNDSWIAGIVLWNANHLELPPNHEWRDVCTATTLRITFICACPA